MRLKDLKIGTKLYSGFFIVLGLTLLVGIISYQGISRIVHQIEISKIVNRIIVDGGDAQANSLRYIMYGDNKYYETVQNESDNIHTQVEEVKKLLLSQENKQVADKIDNAISAYEQDNIDYFELKKEKDVVGKERANAALEATNQIIEVINAATTFSRANPNDYSAVERVYMVQEARNGMNRVRIAANKFVANPSQEFENQLRSEIQSITTTLVDAEKLMHSNVTKRAIAKALKAIENYTGYFNEYKAIVEKQEVIQSRQRKNAGELLSLARNLREGVNDFVDKTESRSYSLLVLFVLAAIVLGLIIGMLITRSITKPLSKSVRFADLISNGDLNQNIEIDQKDEIGMLAKALGDMSNKLKEVVTSIILGSDSIATASQQLSSTSQQLSQGSSEQASSVEEVSSTMEEISSNIQQNTENAQQTEKISNEANKGIIDVAERSNQTVEANKNISDKISIVSDIAFQTNILALNAAVEAARAGEHGKGFAVVAAEVRKLAERSKVAAEEIVGLAQNSLELAQKAGDIMNQTMPKIDNTTNLVQEISAASIEQNNGANQVNNAIQQLNNVTQQNAAASEELATSAEEMSSQAEQLKEVVSFFKVDNNSISTSNANTNTKYLNNPVKKGNGSSESKELVNIELENIVSDDKDFEKF